MRCKREHHKEQRENQCHLELQRIARLLARHRPATCMMPPAQVHRDRCRSCDGAHHEQVGVELPEQRLAEDCRKEQESQEHHRHRHQHGCDVFTLLTLGCRLAVACQHDDGRRAAVETSQQSRHHDARLLEDIPPQEVGKVGYARHHHRGQPDAVRRERHPGDKRFVGQHREHDAGDGEEFGEGQHLVVVHPLHQLGEGVLHLGQHQDGDDDSHREPRRLGVDYWREAVGYQRDDYRRDPVDIMPQLFHQVVCRQQQPDNRAASDEKGEIIR